MNLQEYEALERKRLEINLRHMENGVRFIDLRAAYIDETVEIGKGTVIYPCAVLEGNVKIGEDCIIGQNTRIVDSTIGNGVEIQSSVILESSVGDETGVGPFAYIRPGSEIGSKCKVGDFVEVKNSKMDDGAKAAHLTYIGDADIGKKVNLGCGVVFVNFDGHDKYRSTIGDGSFVGCNANIVSPVTVGEGAYVAAGSTVTEDVPSDALYVARSRGSLKENWVKNKGILIRKKK
jgi:bifunctional UDP-N-acetylglucosamine pyrophosphorylase/glucosamine-1-phosphate N-acetyltransferase